TPAGQDTVLRLKTIHDAVAALIAEHAPDAVALEESYVGADARIALSVGQARGVVLVAAANAGVFCREYAPASVKQAICGYGRAGGASSTPSRRRRRRSARAMPRTRSRSRRTSTCARTSSSSTASPIGASASCSSSSSP